VADHVRVNPDEVVTGARHTGYAISDADRQFIAHETGITEASAGWVGSSHQALQELSTHWESRHEHHRVRTRVMGEMMTSAASRFASTERDSQENLSS
jgi:hypothetical protein